MGDRNKILDVADIVKYQKGTIVSKTLMDKDAGTVTLFAFDEGLGLSEHTAPFDALVHILDGEARVSISRKPYDVSIGQAIILPAGKPHALKATKRFKMMLTMVRK